MDFQGESSGRSTPNSDSAPGKLFVGGLSWQTNQDRLREYFGQFGTVTDVLVMKDPITQVLFKSSLKILFFFLHLYKRLKVQNLSLVIASSVYE